MKYMQRLIAVFLGLMVSTLMYMSVEILGLPKRYVLVIAILAVLAQLIINLLSRDGKENSAKVRYWNLFWEANIVGVWIKDLIYLNLAKLFIGLVIEIAVLVVMLIMSYTRKE